MTLLQTFRDGRPVKLPRTWMHWPIFWLAILWWYVETKHYGWNLTAQSDAEMYCDGLVFLLFALSFRPSSNGGEPR